MSLLRSFSSDTPDSGFLLTTVLSAQNNYPIDGASVSVADESDPDTILEELSTNSVGQTPDLSVATPPIDYSLKPDEPRPYSALILTISAPGFEPLTIRGTEVLPDQTAIQMSRLRPIGSSFNNLIEIPEHTLYGTYPPKNPEAEVKPSYESGEVVLSRVVIPETIVVHDGTPSDRTAPDYYVPYRDYIKNVASSEIYSTWPRQTLEANIHAIMSFTLNRVYTEWYRNQGYNFTITSSTAYDHKWIADRNVFGNISQVVDEIFDTYLSRPNVKQPILTQYCDGKRVSCPQWLSQWGSKYLGDQNYSAIEILQYYYGDTIYINTAEEISGIPSSWPGADLDIGSSGQKVKQIQEQLNLIGEFYNAIPVLVADGIYGERTAEAVKVFQRIFNLPQTGVVDFPTWYKISDQYVRLSGIAELM